MGAAIKVLNDVNCTGVPVTCADVNRQEVIRTAAAAA
jgi:hypothetical protein